MRIIVGITGASGAIYGIRLLEALRTLGIESHLVLSEWGIRTIGLETDYPVESVRKLATKCYDVCDLTAPISSGSFRVDGMVVIPCSMKTLAAISCGLDMNLICRAATVTMKEKRRLILVPRETPFTSIQLENMATLAKNGVTIMPPIPAFYIRPQTVDDIIQHTVGRILDHLGIENDLVRRWAGRQDPIA